MVEKLYVLLFDYVLPDVGQIPNNSKIFNLTLRGGRAEFPKSRSHLKILGGRRVTLLLFYTKDPKLLIAAVWNLVTTATGCLGFVHQFFKTLPNENNPLRQIFQYCFSPRSVDRVS
jgi:hypothetical protein